jgi:RNA polymerase sigma-70 factor (ECF subfamily)
LEARRQFKREGCMLQGTLPPEAPPRPDELLEQKRLTHLELEVLGKVSLPYRTLLIMFELDGLSIPEIAAELSLHLNTAYSRLRLARQQVAAEVRHLGIRVSALNPQSRVGRI